MNTNSHPDRDTLWQVAVGKAIEQEIGAVVSHLEICEACAREFDSFSIANDSAVEKLRCMARADSVVKALNATADDIARPLGLSVAPTSSSAAIPYEALPNDLDRICQAFAEANRFEDKHRIEDFLAMFPLETRPTLFAKMLNIELAKRRETGEAPRAEELEKRWPEYASQIRDLFSMSATSQHTTTVDSPAADQQTSNFGELDGLPTMNLKNAVPSGEEPGRVIAGRYKLLEAIGEGGMGTVWIAEQTAPVRRRVALKVIKAGMDSKSVIARFEAERQALAIMDHPNIAKVLDGGISETGRPFFVMEYVKGVPITNYCDEARLNVPDRLGLFVQVCQAIQHAHQKGIIHRDLKPSNIMVASYDGIPVPKVIDFGLAKAMHQPLTEQTLHTAHGMALGTPLYMSPEQAQFNNIDVDTRADIYSLGVALYELLTGTTPLGKKHFKEMAWNEMQRIIRDEEPPRPSLRLSSSDTLPSLAAGRRTEPARLTKLVRGELDWIVMKALEKDRNRRYETANGFALDIQRYLAGEPVLAAPPSTSYRVRKLARKHRTALTTAAAIMLLLVSSVVISTWQVVRASRAVAASHISEQAALNAQRAEAERAEGERLAKLDAQVKQKEAEQQKSRAEASEQLARDRLEQANEEKQIAQAVKNFLQYKLLRQADMETQANALLDAGKLSSELKNNPTILELLDRAAEELTEENIEENFPKQPYIQAELLRTVGHTYQGIGEYEKSISFGQRAVATYKKLFGTGDPNTLATMHDLANTYWKARKLDRAILLHEETLALRLAKLGSTHNDTLNSMSGLATAYAFAGKHEQAIPLHEETLAIRKAQAGTDHPMTLSSMGSLAIAYERSGKLDLAVPLHEETLKLRKAKLGAEHPKTLTSMNNLALSYTKAGKLELAIPLYEETVARRKVKLGPDHPETLTSMGSLASAYQAAAKLDLAIPLYEETLMRQKAKLGRDHPGTLNSMKALALAYQANGSLDLAVQLLEEGYQASKNFPTYPAVGDSLLDAYVLTDKSEQAIVLASELLGNARTSLPKESAKLSDKLLLLGKNLLKVQAFDDAENYFRECLAIRMKLMPDDWRTWAAKLKLGEALLGQQKYKEAEPLLQKVYDQLKRREKEILNPTSFASSLIESIDRMVKFYESANKPDDVKKWQAVRAEFAERTPAASESP